MKTKDLISLLNRAVAGFETPGDLSTEELAHLTEDLVSAGKFFSGDTELKNLLNRAAAGFETPMDINSTEISDLIADITAQSKKLEVPRNPKDDLLFSAMHENKDRFTIEKAAEHFSGVPRRSTEQ